jgi:hypothetical protein
LACLSWPEQHGFDEEPVTSRRGRCSFLFRQDRLQSSPLILGQRVSMHGDFSSCATLRRNPFAQAIDLIQQSGVPI